jgi:hypothetical protein
MRNAPVYIATNIKISATSTTPAVAMIRRNPRVPPQAASSRRLCDSICFMTGDYPDWRLATRHR